WFRHQRTTGCVVEICAEALAPVIIRAPVRKAAAALSFVILNSPALCWPRVCARSQPGRRDADACVNTSPQRSETAQWLAGESIRVPVCKWLCANAHVEVDRELVPVQDRPLHSSAVARHRDGRELGQQCEPDALPARLRNYEKVLEVQTALCEK